MNVENIPAMSGKSKLLEELQEIYKKLDKQASKEFWDNEIKKKGWYEPLNYETFENIPCAHRQCNECNGTGTKKTGGICVHMLVCRCPRCITSYC